MILTLLSVGCSFNSYDKTISEIKITEYRKPDSLHVINEDSVVANTLWQDYYSDNNFEKATENIDLDAENRISGGTLIKDSNAFKLEKGDKKSLHNAKKAFETLVRDARRIKDDKMADIQKAQE